MAHAESIPEAALLSRARAAGLALRVEGGRLAVSGPKPPDELLAALRGARDDLIRVLKIEAGELSPDPTPVVPLPAPSAPSDQLNGYLRAALQRPVSWADPTARPSQECYCSCCRGQRWWCEREAPKGWRCWQCHPPDGARQQEKKKPAKAPSKTELRINRQMNKTSLVKLWIDPAEYQIVKYTFDNVGFDFLPAQWLVHLSDVKATMTVGQPFPDVWLPTSLGIDVAMTMALGEIDFRYGLDYHDYRVPNVTSKVGIK